MRFNQCVLVLGCILLAASPGWAAYSDVILADAPIAYYTFDTAGNYTVQDDSGNGRVGGYIEGVTTGTEPATELIGGTSVEFDGTTGKIQLDGEFGGSEVTAQTIEAWIKPYTLDPDFQSVVSATSTEYAHVMVTNASTADPPWYCPPGTIRAAWYCDGRTSSIVDSDAVVAMNEWSHVATVVDASGKTEVYINGQVAYHTVWGTPEAPFTSIIAPSTLYIGAGWQGERFFSGMIDEVAIYDTALSEAQIVAHYAAGTGGGPGPLEGDLNEDGVVSGDDLDLVRANWGRTDASGLAEGDATGDGTVGGADLDIVRANWGATAAPAVPAVPEPGGAAVVLGALILTCLRRRLT